MSFPIDIDTFVTPQPGQAMNNPRQTEVIGAIHDALTAVQERVGVVDSEDPESLTAQLEQKADHDHGHVLGDVAELQAFVESKNQPGGLLGINPDGTVNAIVIHRTGTASEINDLVLLEGELASTTDTHELRLGDGTSPGGRTVSPGSVSTVIVYAQGTKTENGTALAAAYSAAASLTPNGASRSATNRATVLVMPGEYDFGAGSPAFIFSTNFVDMVGLGGSGVVAITGNTRFDVDDAHLRGITFRSPLTWYLRADTSANIRWDDLRFLAGGPQTSNQGGSTLRGTFTNIRGTGASFFGSLLQGQTNAGTFIDCEGDGSNWFGGTSLSSPHVITGTLRRCRYTGSSTWNVRVEGRLEDCDFGLARIQRLGGTPVITRCRFAPSSGDSISHNSAINALITFCQLKTAIGSNVTNLVSEGYNIVDSDI